MASDGADLAAALQTVIETGDDQSLSAAIEDAFPGCTIGIDENEGVFELRMYQHGLLRPLRVSELSDGTLRYLLLVAALMTPRPPPLIVLNEPETSLHPDLVAPLGRLIANASQRSQLIVVTHSTPLAELCVKPAAPFMSSLKRPAKPLSGICHRRHGPGHRAELAPFSRV